MGMYRVYWGCCNSTTETEGYEPEECPFCKPDCSEIINVLEELLDDDEIAAVLGRGAYQRIFGVLAKHKSSMRKK
jgi:hypothetical protein